MLDLCAAFTVGRAVMEVDPATTRHKVEYQGRTIAFCAPSCKKMFLADPEAYLTGA